MYPLDVGALQYRVDTGFSVVSPAVSYSWSVLVTGDGGYYGKNHTWGGGLLLRTTWTGSAGGTIGSSQAGWFSAYTCGAKVLANGLTCQSLHPTDLQPIY